ncbi:insulinase family protein [Acidobacteria bacterium ACD]|nr:MAG: insulinase family protein [Acidobacteriota bacterium]MDL1951044.1 insulinase family protein [Acidobacteria bacterium ACD]
MKTTRRTLLLALSAGLLALPAQTLPAAGIPEHPDKLTFPAFTYVPPTAKPYRAALKSGPVAYVAEDRELPLVTVVVTLRGGTYLDPAGKEGLSDLAGYLLARGGTAKRTAEELEERLAFLAANLNSSVGEDRATVSLNLLSKDLDEGLAILREVLTEPRFQEDKLTLRKDQLANDMKSRNDDTADIERRERGFLAWGEGFYVNRYPTKASLEAVKRDDLIAYHRKWFDPRNVIVSASGDFKRAEMERKLDALFAKWPFKGEAAPGVPKPTHAMAAGLYVVDKDVNQGRISVMLPALSRTDPDYVPATLMNDVLGGGGFTSRITNRVRSDEGLAYSAGSRMAGGVWYPGILSAGFQSKSRTCGYATQIVIEEMKKMRDGEVTAEELTTAKRSFVDTLPRRFATKAATMGVLVDEEFTGRYKSDPGFYASYAANVEKVTAADVQRVAKRLLATEKVTVLAVGKKADLLNPDPKHPVDFTALSGGRLVDVPLRDPFTMKPTAATNVAK